MPSAIPYKFQWVACQWNIPLLYWLRFWGYAWKLTFLASCYSFTLKGSYLCSRNSIITLPTLPAKKRTQKHCQLPTSDVRLLFSPEMKAENKVWESYLWPYLKFQILVYTRCFLHGLSSQSLSTGLWEVVGICRRRLKVQLHLQRRGKGLYIMGAEPYAPVRHLDRARGEWPPGGIHVGMPD